MKMLIPLVVFALLQGLLFWIRHKNGGGKVGQCIRNSDWHAWKSTVRDKEAELSALKDAEPIRDKPSPTPV